MHPYVPGHRPAEQEFTWGALRRAELAGFHVEHFAIPPGDWSYCLKLLARWNLEEDWLIVEHDMEPSIELLEAMRDCPHPLCSRFYPIFDGDEEHVRQMEEQRVEWSVAAYFGCTKIAASVRHKMRELPVGRWWHYDSILTIALGNAYGRLPAWHMHPEPLAHHHRRSRLELERAHRWLEES